MMNPPACVATQTLRRRLDDPGDGFWVIPRPRDADVCLGSINLSVGNTFLIARHSYESSIRATRPPHFQRLYDEVRLQGDALITIQPRQFVLAATREYIALPKDLCGFLQSRSSFGRLGLIAATATFVTAGYKGCPTLEIVNVGEAPVQVAPGDPICQLVLLNADEQEGDLRPSRYQCATRPYAALPDVWM